MAVELASGYVSINPSTKGFGSDLNKQLGPEVDRASRDAGQRAGDSFTSSFGGSLKLAAAAAAAFAGVQVGGFLKDSINDASNLGETLSKVSVVLGKEALPGLEAWAEGAATAFGQSKQQALDAAATFAVFGKSAGLTGTDLSSFSTELSGLASDMASFSNTTTDEAITAIGAALRGESEPIRQYGVLLDEATLKNRALSLGIISTTKNALTPQQRVLAAQAEILAQTGDAQGDFARTSGGLANQMRILKAQLANGRAELGEAFLPAVTSVVTFLTSKGIPAFQKFTLEVKDKVAPAFALASYHILGFLRGVRAEFTGTLNPAEGFFAKLGETVGAALRFLKEAFNGATAAVRAFVDGFRGAGQAVKSSPIVGAVESIGDAVAGVFGSGGSVDVFDGSDISNLFESAFDGTRIDLSGTEFDILAAGDPLATAFRDSLLAAGWKGKVEDGIEALYPPKAADGIGKVAQSVDTAQRSFGGFVTVAENAGKRVREAFGGVVGAVESLVEGFKNGSDDLDKNVKFETLARIGETFRSIVDTIRDNKDIFGPIAAGVGALAAALLVMSKVSPAVGLLSGVLANLGGLLPLILNPVGLLLTAVTGLGVAAYLAYQKIEPFREAVDNVVAAFKEGGFGAAVDKAGEEFGRLWDIVQPHLIEFRDKAAAWIGDHAGEIFAGIGKAYAGVVTFLTTELLVPLGNWIVNTGLPFLRRKAGEWATAFSGWVEEKAWPWLRDELPVIIDGIIAWARENEPKLLEAFGKFADAAWKWIEETAIPKLQEKLPGIIAELSAWANDNFSKWGAQIGLLVLDAVGRLTIILLEWVARMVVELPPHLVELGGRIIAALFDKVFGDGDAKLAEFAGKIVGFVAGLPAQIVTAAVGMWHGVTDAFDVMLGTVSADKIVGILTGLPERITTAASGMWNGIYDAFKGALNSIIKAWNGLEFTVGSFHIGDREVFGGVTIRTPDIQELAGGGVFTSDFTGLLRLAETPAARPEIVTPQRLMAETFRKELAAVGVGGASRQVDFGGVTINEAHDPNKTLAVLDGWARWKLTGRGDR